MNIPTHHLTYFFSQIHNEKYIEWRNRLRIEYAIELINNQEQINDATLLVDYIYLDADERRRFAQVGHEYLIEQIMI